MQPLAGFTALPLISTLCRIVVLLPLGFYTYDLSLILLRRLRPILLGKDKVFCCPVQDCILAHIYLFSLLRPGSGITTQIIFKRAYKPFLGLKYVFGADPRWKELGSGMEKIRIRNTSNRVSSLGVADPHHFSDTTFHF
jgi:hypothetical protein